MTIAMIAAASSQKRSGRPFIIKVNHTAGFTVTLPLVNGHNYNFIVNWGDGAVGQVTAYNDADATHIYSGAGTYTITMTGTLEGWSINNGTGLKEYLTEITQWGRTGFKYLARGFYGCTRLTACYGKLDLSQVANVSWMFRYCSALTTLDVSDWDVSGVTTFGDSADRGIFATCTGLTSLDCSKWRFSLSTLVNATGIFYGCSNLTTIGDVSGWNTERLNSLSHIFYGCSKLQSLNVGGWDVSNVIYFSGTFAWM